MALASITLASTANPSPLTRPTTIQAATTRSKTWRRISLSRKRPSRFTENVEWCGNLVVEIELAEPAVSKVQRHFLAQPTLMANAIAVTNQEHPDHQLGINRGPADVAVKRL